VVTDCSVNCCTADELHALRRGRRLRGVHPVVGRRFCGFLADVLGARDQRFPVDHLAIHTVLSLCLERTTDFQALTGVTTDDE